MIPILIQDEEFRRGQTAKKDPAEVSRDRKRGSLEHARAGFPQNQAVADRDRRDPNEAGDERHERSQNCGKPVPAQSAGASPASLAGKGGRDAGAAGRDARALAEAQPQVARGEVAPARASSMIRRMVRAQRPHSALHPKHR